MPVAFESVLAFMATSYAEARTEYFNMLNALVGELLAGCPEFIQIFKSDLCFGRLVPKE